MMKLLHELDAMMDSIYGYMVLKSYVFLLRFNGNYANRDYAERWKKYGERFDKSVLSKACEALKNCRDGKILDLVDAMDRSSYYALIHPEHPNITLGFIKDADLWNLWLESGIYRYVRRAIAEILEIGSGDKIVDFGCGSASPKFYSSLIGSSGLYVGIDYSKPLLNIAEKKCRNEKLIDRVRLIHSKAESRIHFNKNYDVAIISAVAEYSSISGILRNALEALGYEGSIAIFSELFVDLQPERVELFNLYYSLIPGFRSFPSLREIEEFFEKIGLDYSLKPYGNHLLVVQL